MNWNQYQRFLEQKLSDAKYNLESAKRKYEKSKCEYEAVVMEKKAFEKALDDLVGEK